MKYFIALLLALSFSADAAVVDVQRTQGFTANCDNATTREDGSALPLSEIHSVTFFMYAIGETNVANYAAKQEVLGGCRSVTIITKDLTAGKTYNLQAVTTDTGTLVSDLSATSVNTYAIQNSRPKNPKNLR